VLGTIHETLRPWSGPRTSALMVLIACGLACSGDAPNDDADGAGAGGSRAGAGSAAAGAGGTAPAGGRGGSGQGGDGSISTGGGGSSGAASDAGDDGSVDPPEGGEGGEGGAAAEPRPMACRLDCDQDDDCCPMGVDCSMYPSRVVCLEGGICAQAGCADDADCESVHGATWGCFELAGGRRCQQKCTDSSDCQAGCMADSGGSMYCPPTGGGGVNPGGPQTECEIGCYGASKPTCIDGIHCGCTQDSECVGELGTRCDSETSQCGCGSDDDCGAGYLCDYCTADANGVVTCAR
jgi:hypothetical protein